MYIQFFWNYLKIIDGKFMLLKWSNICRNIVERKKQGRRSYMSPFYKMNQRQKCRGKRDRPEKRENAVKVEIQCCHFSRYERWHDQVSVIAKVKANRMRARLLWENGRVECAGILSLLGGCVFSGMGKYLSSNNNGTCNVFFEIFFFDCMNVRKMGYICKSR